MTAAIERYRAMIDAVAAQRERLHGGPWPGNRWSGEHARRFRLDPHRALSPNLAAVAGYVEAATWCSTWAAVPAASGCRWRCAAAS